jgi:hypothetical protein
MRFAVWAAAALTVGWLAVGAAELIYGRGHPPAWFVVGEGVVMASFVIAPIGILAGVIALWRARKETVTVPQITAAALGLNMLFLAVAVGFWVWLMTVTS